MKVGKILLGISLMIILFAFFKSNLWVRVIVAYPPVEWITYVLMLLVLIVYVIKIVLPVFRKPAS